MLEDNDCFHPGNQHRSFTEASLMSVNHHENPKTFKDSSILHSNKAGSSNDHRNVHFEQNDKSKRIHGVQSKVDSTWEPSVVKFHFISKQDLLQEKSLHPDLDGLENAIEQMRKARLTAAESLKQGHDSAKSRNPALIKRRPVEFQTKKIKASEPQHPLMLNAVANSRKDKPANSNQQSTDELMIKDTLPPWLYTDFRSPPKLVETKVQTKKEQLQLIKSRIGQPSGIRSKPVASSDNIKPSNSSLSPDIKKNKDSSSRLQVVSLALDTKQTQPTVVPENKEAEQEFLLRCASVSYEGKVSTMSLLKHSSTRNIQYYNQEFPTSSSGQRYPKYSEPMDDAMKDRILIGRRVKQTHSYMLIDDISRTKPTTKGMVQIKGSAVKIEQLTKMMPHLEKRNSGIFESFKDGDPNKPLTSKRAASRQHDIIGNSRSHLLDSRMRNLARLSMKHQQGGLYHTFANSFTF